MNRRGLLAGILAAGFAPAAVGSGILMPVRRIVTPPALPTGEHLRRIIQRVREQQGGVIAPPETGYIMFIHPDWHITLNASACRDMMP